MVTTSVNKELIKLRNLSSVFSRNAFVDVLNYNAYSHFNWLASKYDTLKCTTYFELLKKSYSLISKYYRCEYVYKNEGYRLPPSGSADAGPQGHSEGLRTGSAAPGCGPCTRAHSPCARYT